MTVAISRRILPALAASCLLSSAWATESRSVVVTPEALLEHMSSRVAELAALPDVAWVEGGRRVLLSIATDTPALDNSSGDDSGTPATYSVATVDVDSGDVTLLGAGYQPVGAPRGDTVAYFDHGSDGHQITLARIDGARRCTIRDRDLLPDATGIQSLAFSDDGKNLVLAVGFTEHLADEPSMRAAGEAAVRVFESGQESSSRSGVALWVTDASCRKPRRVVTVPRYRIGRLAWIHRTQGILAVAETAVPGQGFPRTDLLLLDTAKEVSRTFIRNIGGQAFGSRTGFLSVSPSGESVAFTYDKEGLPYLLRRQVAVATIADGKIRIVSNDPREGEGWLDSKTLWITRSAAHPLMAGAAMISMGGSEHELRDVPGHGVPSPDGRRMAWLENDLYGNSSLLIASVERSSSGAALSDRRTVWREQSKLARYARGERRLARCVTSDGVQPAAIVTLPLNYQPGRRYPAIVDIHGGPRGGLAHPMHPYATPSILNGSTLEHDLWAAKGYLVLAPDYRGSGLYGFDKVARDGSAFEDDFEDILCNVRAAIEQGLVDADRMAVIGHSRGGMEVNWIVTHSDLFRAAISKEGSFNVNFAVAWGSRGQVNQHMDLLFGTPYDFPERYRRMSVMDSVGGVTTPTLFVEHRGGKRAGDLYAWMFAAWQQQGVRAQLRLYDEEKHALRRPADWKDVLNASIAWIDEQFSAAQSRVSANAEPAFKPQ